MNWLEVAALPLATGLIAVFGYFVYKIVKIVLGNSRDNMKIFADNAVAPIRDTMEAQTDAIKSCINTMVVTVNNHLAHSSQSDDRLADAVGRLVDKLGDGDAEYPY